jgi:hypothetical protein
MHFCPIQFRQFDFCSKIWLNDLKVSCKFSSKLVELIEIDANLKEELEKNYNKGWTFGDIKLKNIVAHFFINFLTYF